MKIKIDSSIKFPICIYVCMYTRTHTHVCFGMRSLLKGTVISYIDPQCYEYAQYCIQNQVTYLKDIFTLNIFCILG